MLEEIKKLRAENKSLRQQLAKNKAAREWVDTFGPTIESNQLWKLNRQYIELRALIQPEKCEHDVVFQPDEEGPNARGIPVCRKCRKEIIQPEEKK